MDTQSLTSVVNSVIPLQKGVALTYNKENNILTTNGYTSLAGNTYFNGIRLSEKIILILNIGIGHTHTFINGIQILSAIDKQQVIAQTTLSIEYYSEEKIKRIAKSMIFEKLKENALKEGVTIDDESLSDFSQRIIEDAYKDQIEEIKKMQIQNLLLSAGGK